MYFHGHSVGGTNPSLLEAMASRALICAHDNGFNRAILGTDAFYFTTSREIAYAASLAAAGTSKEMINNNFEKASTHYNWETIIAAYNDFFIQSVTLKK
jgi:glycosyltransferase involved in cell wall biosynthesis